MGRVFDWKRLSFIQKKCIMGTVCNLIEPSTIYSQNDLVLSRKGTII
jgi:hypothetical protein